MSSRENICNAEYTDGNGNSPTEEKKNSNKEHKMLRLLTVIAYLISVSMPAMILSSYYIFIWESPKGNSTANHTN